MIINVGELVFHSVSPRVPRAVDDLYLFPWILRPRILLPSPSPFPLSGGIWISTKINCNGSFRRTLSQQYVLLNILAFESPTLILRASQGCLLLLTSRLVDIYGRKKIFVIGALCLAALAIGCAFTSGKSSGFTSPTYFSEPYYRLTPRDK